MNDASNTGRPVWTDSSVIQVDGRPVTIVTSNVAPPGVRRRAYWFSIPPASVPDAEALAGHIRDLRNGVDQVDIEPT